MDCSRSRNQYIFQNKFLIWIVVLITFLTMDSKLAIAFGNETDRQALLALKYQLLDGSPAGILSSWNASLHFCEWQGVRCGQQHQRVISLKLSSMKLGGSISPSIGNLSFLREANLSDNMLQGNIPRELGQLKRLRNLNLGHNNLQGNIPMELSNCSNLKLINFYQNSLSGKIPFSFGDADMRNLTSLAVASNNLTGGIPSSLGNFSSLVYLQLSSNHLEGIIPDALGRLSNLKVLLIDQNNLSGTIPSSFYNVSSMEYVDMRANQLSGGLAPEIGFAFPKLGVLNIGENQFSGSIPASLTNISSLEQLDIHENGFSGSVPENLGHLKNLAFLILDSNKLGMGKAGDVDFLSPLANCSQLTFLSIIENSFGGVLPDSVANFSTQLDVFCMGGNQISGSIPEGIGNLVNLTQFDIGVNFLTGTIPTSIGKLQNLGLFDLSVNRLWGAIPSSIGNLSQLCYLYLKENEFEGKIPSTLSKCKRIEKMDLSVNKFGGSIPDELIAGFESLITLNLSHNSFTGAFPRAIGNSKNLVELRVDNNNFSGEIPERIGEISELAILHMQGNNFQGSIPLSFVNLKALENLDLSDNSLSGTIPDELQELPFLVSLNLSFNHLEGEVPQKGVFKNISEFSITGNRELCGGILEIELPKCFNLEAKKKGKALPIKLIVTVSLASIVVVVLVILCQRKRLKREITRMALLPVGYLRVSYKELFEATNGFASSNYLGGGSFGSVYRGTLHQYKKSVAVKILNLENLGAINSVKVECEALRKIRHQNLVKLITTCSSVDYLGNNFRALVYEFMPNGSLASWLHDHQNDSRHLNFAQILDITIDVANALDYLHNHCETLIVHRNLKPTNVLLDDDMVAHVSDFGMAKLLSRAASKLGSEQATSSIIKGTIGYLAPEYGIGNSSSPEGDVYSYGILLLEMITAKRPTCDLFHDDLSLHNFCKMVLPGQLEEIVDFRLIEQINEKSQNIESEIWECLVAFTKVGVACSEKFPVERMKIEDAIDELHAIKARLLALNYVVPLKGVKDI
ncbi:hypothetical protein DITRI_Ditri09bG0108300 [Diplodiscus trichospermus]